MKLKNVLSSKDIIMNKIDFLKKKAKVIRRDVVEVAVRNGAGHIAPSLSCVDILVALYYDILHLSSVSYERDKLILSKAHGPYALYSILSDLKLVKREDWDNFYKNSFLKGCVERSPEHGLEAGCGALGHGLPIAVGLAFAGVVMKKNFRIFCIVGDGELQEGSNWEAIQFAVKHCLNRLIVIVDANGLQAMDFLTNILTPVGKKNDIEEKLQAFGMKVHTCNGHNLNELTVILKNMYENKSTKPCALIANTIKGYGLKCMENIARFHFRLPTKEELDMGWTDCE